jgi:hypothetical protein
VEIKCQLDPTDEFLLQILLLAQHVSGTIMPIIRRSRVLYKWFLPVLFGAWFSSCCNPQTGHTTLSSTLHRQLEHQAPNTKHVEQAVRSAIKIHLLHLIGILCPHIIDDARSKPHQKWSLHLHQPCGLFVRFSCS